MVNAEAGVFLSRIPACDIYVLQHHQVHTVKADMLSGFISMTCFKRMDEHVGIEANIKIPPISVFSFANGIAMCCGHWSHVEVNLCISVVHSGQLPLENQSQMLSQNKQKGLLSCSGDENRMNVKWGQIPELQMFRAYFNMCLFHNVI